MAIPLFDFPRYSKRPKSDPYGLLTDFMTQPTEDQAMEEAETIEILVPGLGSLCNDHPALENIEHIDDCQTETLSYNRSHPGVGSSTYYQRVCQKALRDIPAGSGTCVCVCVEII